MMEGNRRRETVSCRAEVRNRHGLRRSRQLSYEETKTKNFPDSLVFVHTINLIFMVLGHQN